MHWSDCSAAYYGRALKRRRAPMSLFSSRVSAPPYAVILLEPERNVNHLMKANKNSGSAWGEYRSIEIFLKTNQSEGY